MLYQSLKRKLRTQNIHTPASLLFHIENVDPPNVFFLIFFLLHVSVCNVLQRSLMPPASQRPLTSPRSTSPWNGFRLTMMGATPSSTMWWRCGCVARRAGSLPVRTSRSPRPASLCMNLWREPTMSSVSAQRTRLVSVHPHHLPGLSPLKSLSVSWSAVWCWQGRKGGWRGGSGLLASRWKAWWGKCGAERCVLWPLLHWMFWL